MAGWKDMLLDVLRLTDEVKRMNRDIERVEFTLLGGNCSRGISGARASY